MYSVISTKLRPVTCFSNWGSRSDDPDDDGDSCNANGMKLDFKQTEAERLATGVPRPSIEERYKNHGQYGARLARAADRLVRQRFLHMDG